MPSDWQLKHCIITITDGQTARLLMGVSITPPLPHPTSSVSIPTTIKLMCIGLTDRADNCQPLSIAARAPYRPDRQNDINSQDRTVHTTDYQQNSAASQLLSPPPKAGPAWQSFVGLQCAPVRADVGDAVCVSALRSVCATRCIYRIASLSRCRAKIIKGQSKQKAVYFIYKQ